MKRIAVLFSGQGSQYVGMGRQLFERDAQVRELFDSASQVLDMDMQQLCFAGHGDALNLTENTQPALLLCGLAEYRHFRARSGLNPAFLAGHSLGELTALVAAEAIGLEDGLRLARQRGLAMSRCGEAGGAGMHAVTKLELEQVEAICQALPGFGSELVIANRNAPTQAVLSGSLAALERAGEALKQAGGNIIPLKVSGPFHSPFMAPAAEALAAQLRAITIQRPRIPVIANVDARPHGEPEEIAAALVRQLTASVQWVDTMQWLHAEGVDLFLEAGPRSVLKRLVLNNLPGAKAYALDEEEDQPLIEQEFAADLRAMQERPSLIAKCMAVAVCTRNQNWDDAAYQQGVVLPYRQLQALQEGLEREGREATEPEMRSALDLLAQIFTTKGTPEEEQEWRFAQILETTGVGELADWTPRRAAA